MITQAFGEEIRSTNSPETLDEILFPMPGEIFLKNFWGKNYLVIEGEECKFSTLLSWKELGRILEEHRLDAPRIRLAKDGVILPASEYIDYRKNRRRQFSSVPQLRQADINSHIDGGATLIIDAVDELAPNVTLLAENLEHIFREKLQVNLYAGWRLSNGFNLHWDNHDVFILQLQGQKDWKVYEPTRKYPMQSEFVKNSVRPETPIWEGTLTQGDLLYMPRGWWHVAQPLNEPSLHLTVGFPNSTGMSLLGWLVDQARELEDFRRDLPLFSSAEEKRAYGDKLKEQLFSLWKDDIIEDFYEQHDANSLPRPKFSFPLRVTPEKIVLNDNTKVRFAIIRPINIKTDENGAIVISARRKTWTFHSSTEPIFQKIRDRKLHSIAEIYVCVRDSIPRSQFDKFIRELITKELLLLDE